MKTTTLLTLSALLGSCLIASAEDTTKPGDRPARPLPPKLLEKFDTDGDGKLSPEEKQAARDARKETAGERRKEILEKYDTDQSGDLSDDEKAKMREDFQAKALEKFDTDGDGQLSEEERAAMPKHPRRPGGPGKGGPGGKPGKGGPAAAE